MPIGARVLAVASGKGGVGKSSITANLAAALAQRGFAVGVIDADIWGFSIPRMLGLEGRLHAEANADGGRRIQPHSVPVGTGRLDVVSMGLLVDDETDALMWRGLILNRAVQHFLEDVAWADDLDYLVIDLPPGTGDVQMGLARMLPQSEMIVVTTPALAAQRVASRAVTMARKSHLHVLGCSTSPSTSSSGWRRPAPGPTSPLPRSPSPCRSPRPGPARRATPPPRRTGCCTPPPGPMAPNNWRAGCPHSTAS